MVTLKAKNKLAASTKINNPRPSKSCQSAPLLQGSGFTEQTQWQALGSLRTSGCGAGFDVNHQPKNSPPSAKKPWEESILTPEFLEIKSRPYIGWFSTSPTCKQKTIYIYIIYILYYRPIQHYSASFNRKIFKNLEYYDLKGFVSQEGECCIILPSHLDLYADQKHPKAKVLLGSFTTTRTLTPLQKIQSVCP